jgi:lipoprotein-releasing system permease protein
MYKLLLCSRYLRTRYIALASIISVMLGVATMIVVNSVMAGFREEMHKRLHGILSDIVVEAHSLEGIVEPAAVEATIRRILGDQLEGMTATVHVPAIISWQFRGQWITRQVNLIGVDPRTYAQVSDFGQYLLHPENRRQLTFALRARGYDKKLGGAGWGWRRERVAFERAYQAERDRLEQARARTVSVPSAPSAASDATLDPWAAEGQGPQPSQFDAARQQHTGMVLGISVAGVRARDADGQARDFFLCRPGDDVRATFYSAGTPPEAVNDYFTVVDMYESKMSEYDASFAFVPLQKLQQLRRMHGWGTPEAAVTAIQLKLRPGADLVAAREKLRAAFPPETSPYQVQTWRDMQGPLLAAVQLETTILNILLFLIIAVAGFGILATFFMIVVEKTRDIGILKSLGASHRGVMAIFLSYGLSLGVVGASVGMVLGLVFVANINAIAALVERLTGREVFDPTVYYFSEIPTIISPLTVGWIVVGAMMIAVLASVLPAVRAARMQPVEALRYE